MRAKMLSVFAVIVGAFLMTAVPMPAHHSFSAEYDKQKPVTLKGTVTCTGRRHSHRRACPAGRRRERLRKWCS